MTDNGDSAGMVHAGEWYRHMHSALPACRRHACCGHLGGTHDGCKRRVRQPRPVCRPSVQDRVAFEEDHARCRQSAAQAACLADEALPDVVQSELRAEVHGFTHERRRGRCQVADVLSGRRGSLEAHTDTVRCRSCMPPGRGWDEIRGKRLAPSFEGCHHEHACCDATSASRRPLK